MSELLIGIIHPFQALYKLIRILPVLSWGVSASLVGMGFAYSFNPGISWLDYGLIVLVIVLVHGAASHAYNDREDWLSGTDVASPGILSGGSGVIRRGFLGLDELSIIGRAALGLAGLIFAYFLWKMGPVFLLIPVVAVWSALAYTCPPLRLSYHPWTGEWLCAFPALFTCVAGTFYVLTGTIRPAAIMGGIIHALLAMSLLMHHHISDISSDLQASPRKLTTVARVALSLGLSRTPLVAFSYSALALLLSIAAALFLNPVFSISVLVSLGCMTASLKTNPADILSITGQEYWFYRLIIGDAVVKAGWLILRHSPSGISSVLSGLLSWSHACLAR